MYAPVLAPLISAGVPSGRIRGKLNPHPVRRDPGKEESAIRRAEYGIEESASSLAEYGKERVAQGSKFRYN